MGIGPLGSYSYGVWEAYFAWLPKRTISGHWVWLQSIYRRDYLFKPVYVQGYQYATVLDILALDK